MAESIVDRLAAAEARIGRACERAGRARDGVRVVAVAKTHGPEAVADAAAAGLRVFGENRVQEARQKIPLCPGDLEWHMVGHLQRNKVRAAVDLFHTFHAVDSPRLLDALDAACGAAGRAVPVCLEINVSGESSKFGFAPETVPQLLRDPAPRNVDIVGLMTIPPFTPDPEDARPVFRRLRELRDAWQAECGVGLPELSMGMSHDFDVAIEEGATWIRLGTLIFGRRAQRQAATGEGGHGRA